MAGGGGNTNVQIILKGGGGQKCPKICPHGLWMTPEIKMQFEKTVHSTKQFCCIALKKKYLKAVVYDNSSEGDG